MSESSAEPISYVWLGEKYDPDFVYRPADFPYNQGKDIELIWPEEVIDTTFTISRRLMSTPQKFLKIISKVQMKGRNHLEDKMPNYYLKLESPLDSALLAELTPALKAGESVMFIERISKLGYTLKFYTPAKGFGFLVLDGSIKVPPYYLKNPSVEEKTIFYFVKHWEKDSVLQRNADGIEKYKKGDRTISEYVNWFSCECATRLEPIGNSIHVSMIKYYPDIDVIIKGGRLIYD